MSLVPKPSFIKFHVCRLQFEVRMDFSCRHWLATKKRFCAGVPLPGLQFCGNHRPFEVDTRIPCPIDPSHTISKENLDAHVTKCPAAKQLKANKERPYYQEACNAGSYDDNYNEDCDLAPQLAGTILTSAKKRLILQSMSQSAFKSLIDKIEGAYQMYYSDGIEQSFLQPVSCHNWLTHNFDRRLPFQERHIYQQASMLGNVELFGLLLSQTSESEVFHQSFSICESGQHNVSPRKRVFLELGAGRGYLSHMLSDCYGVSDILLVERRSYKFKADRTLRHTAGVALNRLRIDIEDLDLRGVDTLHGRHFVALSKHLCGPATDFALRCCLARKLDVQPTSMRLEKSTHVLNNGPNPTFDGLAIATCCHHLCQWSSYVNKTFFRDLGFSIDEFHVVTWLTSWALCGYSDHETEQSNNNDYCELNDFDMSSFLDVKDKMMLGLKAKYLLDVGRLQWLNNQGMVTKVVEYVPNVLSPENKLLMAKWP